MNLSGGEINQVIIRISIQVPVMNRSRFELVVVAHRGDRRVPVCEVIACCFGCLVGALVWDTKKNDLPCVEPPRNDLIFDVEHEI